MTQSCVSLDQSPGTWAAVSWDFGSWIGLILIERVLQLKLSPVMFNYPKNEVI